MRALRGPASRGGAGSRPGRLLQQQGQGEEHISAADEVEVAPFSSFSRPSYSLCWKRPFFSAGLSIWKEHMSVSSTDIIAPALSNSPQ